MMAPHAPRTSTTPASVAGTSASAPVACAVLLACVAALTGCGGEVQIVHGLAELEANEILVTLEAKGIAATKIVEEGRVVTYAVAVSEMDQRDAMRLLVANRLPRTPSSGFSEVYPVGGGGLIPTQSEEKAKFLMAVQGEIERKLKSVPGIVSAHVTVVWPDKDIVRDLDTPPPAATASVAIVYNPDERQAAALKEEEVQKLVAAGVEDLKPSNVTVIMKRNAPSVLVDIFASPGLGEAPVAAVSQFGLKFADRKSAQKLLVGGGAAVFIALICLAVGVGGIVRAMGLSRRMARAEAELASQRKARRDTQTGMQQA